MSGRWPSRGGWVSLALAATVLLAPDALPGTQERKKEKCKWPGSMWATSAKLYLNTARGNPRLKESRELYQKALKVSSEGIGKKPDNSQHYLRAGEAYVGLGDLVGADTMLAKAEELAPACQEEIDQVREDAWAATFNAGVGHLRAGNEARALAQFEKANVVHQKRPEALLQIGALYSRRSDRLRQEALGAEEARAAQLNTQADSLLEGAIEAYRRAAAVATTPDHQQIASFNLAQLLAIHDRYEDAVDAYRAYLENNPDHVIAQTNLAVTLVRWADDLSARETPDDKARAEQARAEAARVYDDVLSQPNLSVDDLLTVGSGLSSLGEYPGAVRAFRQVLRSRPYDHDALVELANAFYLTGQADSLLPVAQKLAELYPNHSNNLAFLAYAYRETGATKKALEVLERREKMPFEVNGLNLSLDKEAQAIVLRGRIQNRKLAPDTPVALRFDFLDKDGQIVATEEVSKPAPEKGLGIDFEIQLQVTDDVAGFRYSSAS